MKWKLSSFRSQFLTASTSSADLQMETSGRRVGRLCQFTIAPPERSNWRQYDRTSQQFLFNHQRDMIMLAVTSDAMIVNDNRPHLQTGLTPSVSMVLVQRRLVAGVAKLPLGFFENLIDNL